MKGLFWTKVCGISWVVSWLVIELLSFIAPNPTSADWIGGNVNSSSTPNPEVTFWSGDRYQIQVWKAYIKRLHSELLTTAVSIQFWASLSMLRHLLSPELGFPKSIAVAVAECVTICYYALGILPPMIGRKPERVKVRFGQIPPFGWVLDWWSGTSWVVMGSGLLQWLLSFSTEFRKFLQPWQSLFVQYLLLVIFIIGISITRSLCRQLVRRFRKETKARYRWPADINSRHREPETREILPDESDGEKLWIAGLLLTNFTIWVLWFAYRYNSEGTETPHWTSVFGK
ncbi:hypothetical protein EG329_014127 [Mollisiaceae sp. DMI_Dod_QoI]|nr:hypothetical protein EG329_014127 [Helotiales sp. DMI_Dod_QoI]